MISREKCLEWAKEISFVSYGKNAAGNLILSCDELDLEAIINRAYAEGQKDMRELITNPCQSSAELVENHTGV